MTVGKVGVAVMVTNTDSCGIGSGVRLGDIVGLRAADGVIDGGRLVSPLFGLSGCGGLVAVGFEDDLSVDVGTGVPVGMGKITGEGVGVWPPSQPLFHPAA